MKKLLEPYTQEIISDKIPLQELIEDKHAEFYRYEGSLTYPDCHNNKVLWTIMTEPLTIAKDTLARFRELKDKNKNPKNKRYRSKQELGDSRKITKTKKADPKKPTKPSTKPTTPSTKPKKPPTKSKSKPKPKPPTSKPKP